MRRCATAWRGSRAIATCAAPRTRPDESALDKLTRETIWRVVTPALAQAPREARRAGASRRGRLLHGSDGPLPRHSDGAARAVRDPRRLLRRRRADEPAGVRRHGHGFNYYHGADPSEYDLVLSNSEGGLPRLLELGARRAEAVFWGADPSSSRRSRWPRRWTCSSTATATSSARSGRRRWSVSRAGRRRRSTSRSAGRDFRGDTGSAREIGDVPFNVFARAISSARINLNVTRRSHATVPLSSTCRPFELASAGAAIVSNPHEGIEQWFEPGSEIIVVAGRRRGARRVPRAARRPRRGGRDGRPRPRARARRAHLCPPGTPRARPARPRLPGSPS